MQRTAAVRICLPVLLVSAVAAGCVPEDPALAPSGDARAPDAAPAVSRPPPPDAAPPEPDAGPTLVPGIGVRFEPPAPAGCVDKTETPILPDEDDGEAAPDEWSKRSLFDLEENGGLDPARVLRDDDPVALGEIVIVTPPVLVLPLDPDRDCLATADELRLGTDPNNPDTDGDGWFDGPCNERRKLILVRIHARDEQEDFGDDELYLVADDLRHPRGDLDDVWDFDDGDSMTTSWLLAQRVRGTGDARLALVRVEGWEDDFELLNTWTPDDLLFELTVDLGAHAHGTILTERRAGDDDYDYELTLRVDVERFADPSPLEADVDGDGDGIVESDEARVARDLGGLADPERPDVLVEVDWMRGHALRTQAKRQVVTQLARNGLTLTLLRDDELPVDGCVTVPEARRLYLDHFDHKGYGAFRYAVIGEELWNDASGVAWGDIFFVDDSTWWINGWVLPQAGTFIHELGHTMGLTNRVFHLIDSIAWFSYDSAMNYLYQATKVDYSHDGGGGSSWDHDDWSVVDPAYALKWSFGLVTSQETGACE